MPTAKLGSYTVEFLNSEEYHSLKNEIFTQNCYYWDSPTSTPRILDLGAHVGLATLYFKKLYPAAQIIAVEPHPETFQLLKRNIEVNQLDQVILHNAAIATSSGTTSLHIDTEHQWWSTASQRPGAWTGTQKTKELSVPALTLAELLTQPVDLLKMDIEGSEQAVLGALATKARLSQVKHTLIEFHPHSGQNLVVLLTLLRQFFPYVETFQYGKAVSPTKAKGLVLIEAGQNSF